MVDGPSMIEREAPKRRASVVFAALAGPLIATTVVSRKADEDFREPRINCIFFVADCTPDDGAIEDAPRATGNAAASLELIDHATGSDNLFAMGRTQLSRLQDSSGPTCGQGDQVMVHSDG